MTRDVQTRLWTLFARQWMDADATLCVAADVDDRTQTVAHSACA